MSNPSTSLIYPLSNETGYISSSSIDSNNNLIGKINTLDNVGKYATSVYPPTAGINNVWGITSPNTNDQILIMTNDSQYITGGLLGTITTNILKGSVTSISSLILTSFYISLYFILTYGFRSGIIFNFILTLLIPGINIQSTILIPRPSPPITTLTTTDPNYATWNNISSYNANIKQVYACYAICADIAKNGSNSSYYKTLDPNNTIFNLYNVKSDDWLYISNYFNTIYTFYSTIPSTFCVNFTNKMLDIFGPVQCSSVTNGSPVINTPNGPYGYGGTASTLLNNKNTIIWIIVCLICICCCISAGVFMMMSMKSSGRRRHRGGLIEDNGYYYLK